MTFSNTIAVRNTQAQAEGSLHWAIQEANRLPGHDHIVFTQGASGGTIVRDPLVPFALTFSILESVTITGQNVTILADYLGDDVTATVTLPDGRSVAGVTDVLASLEDGNRLSDNSQLFSAFGADTHLTLNGLTLIGSASTTRWRGWPAPTRCQAAAARTGWTTTPPPPACRWTSASTTRWGATRRATGCTGWRM